MGLVGAKEKKRVVGLALRCVLGHVEENAAGHVVGHVVGHVIHAE